MSGTIHQCCFGFKTQSVSLAAYYFVDITVTAAVKKNESEIKAWVSVAPPTEQVICNCRPARRQIFVTWLNNLMVVVSAHADIPKQPGELPAWTADSWIELLHPCNSNPKLQSDYSSAKPYKHNHISSFTKQQHNYRCKNYSSTEQQ